MKHIASFHLGALGAFIHKENQSYVVSITFCGDFEADLHHTAETRAGAFSYALKVLANPSNSPLPDITVSGPVEGEQQVCLAVGSHREQWYVPEKNVAEGLRTCAKASRLAAERAMKRAEAADLAAAILEAGE